MPTIRELAPLVTTSAFLDTYLVRLPTSGLLGTRPTCLNFESPNCLFCNNLPLCSQLFCQAGLHSNDPILATKESKVQPPKLDRMALTVGQLVEGVTPIT